MPTIPKFTPPRAPSLADLSCATGLPPAAELDDAKLKSFLTQRTDTFRAPYAPRVDVSIYVGTSGQRGPMLRDDSGVRRFTSLHIDPAERTTLWADVAKGGA